MSVITINYASISFPLFNNKFSNKLKKYQQWLKNLRVGRERVERLNPHFGTHRNLKIFIAALKLCCRQIKTRNKKI